MPMLGKAAKSARNFLGSDAGQALLSTLSIFVPGDPYGFVQSRKARQEKDARQQTMLSAFNDLIGQIQPPDTYTPQVNQLIGAANETGGRFGMAPMQRETPRPSGLDLQDPRTREALMSFVGAGGNVDAPFALADRMAPKPSYRIFEQPSGIVAVDENTLESDVIRRDPLALAAMQRRLEQYDPNVYGTPAWARVQPPAPKSGKGGGGGGSAKPGPKGGPIRVLTF